MNTVRQVMAELKKKGTEQTRKTWVRQGAPKDVFGVKVADLKVIAKKIEGKQTLACDLYETGNVDAMYLAGLVADGSQMTKKQLESWVKSATCGLISEYAVPWVTTESHHATALAMKWIKSKKESVACSGWCTYGGIIATRADDELDFAEIKELLNRVAKGIGTAPNLVRYTMNGFVIATGAYVKPLLNHAKRVAKSIGTVSVDMGDTACKVPLATAYLEKIESMERVGKKRKTIRC
jgi:hypothetical protein